MKKLFDALAGLLLGNKMDRLKSLVAAGKLTPEEYLEVTGEAYSA